MINATTKYLLRRLGLFSIAWTLYRRINPGYRREKQVYQAFYQNLISKNDLCFDIGANLGQTTEVLAKSGAIVVSVEPNPLCLTVLSRHAAIPNIKVINKAVGSSKGITELRINGTDPAASIREDWPYIQCRDSVLVELTTLDALIQEHGRPKLLKVDVEGYEVEVFNGLSQPIELIYFEIHGQELQMAEQVLDRLNSLGKVLGVKTASGDNSTWLIDEWSPPNKAFEHLSDIRPRVANMLVKMHVAN